MTAWRALLLRLADAVPREQYEAQHRGFLDIIDQYRTRLEAARRQVIEAEERARTGVHRIRLSQPGYRTRGGAS